MNSYSRSRYSNQDKIESIKNKLNASNIIKKDFFNQSQSRQPQYTPQVRNVQTNYRPQNSTYKNAQLSHGGNYGDLKSKVQREINKRVNLSTEKKELELMIEDQVEAQEKLKEEYNRHIEGTKQQIERLDQMIEGLQKEVEIKMEKYSKIEEENGDMENEINEVLEENRLLEQEMEKLGQKTNQKMMDMQKKMESGLGDLENLKQKHEAELEKIHNFSGDKIKRIEDDYQKKMEDITDRYNEMLLAKQDSESELLRLQDGKKRAEIELENKIKAIKDQYFDDEYNKFRGVLKIYNNRLRNAAENKENLLKKKEQLEKDLELMEDDMKVNENQIEEENNELSEAIANLKNDISTIRSEMETHRNDNYNHDSKIQKIQSEIQRNKFNFKQISENGKHRIKETIEKNKLELEQMDYKFNNQQMKVRELEEELKQLNVEYVNAEKQNERMIGNMRSQLNKNIFQTINEYKDFNTSKLEQPLNGGGSVLKNKSYKNSYYLN